jgi:predicted TIM-barrel fold metal-dependent hydrolase
MGDLLRFMRNYNLRGENMIIDAHVHIMYGGIKRQTYTYTKTREEDWPAERLIELLDRVGIDKAVIFGSNLIPLADYKENNDDIADAVKKFPDRFIGFGSVDPRCDPEGAPREVVRAVEGLGLRGLKFHPWLQVFPANDYRLYPIMEVASRYKLPVIFHMGTPPYCQPFQLADVASHFPEVQFIIGHFGKLLWLDSVRSAIKHDNIYLETSGAQSADIECAVKMLGHERIVFGTDLPLGGIGAGLWDLVKIRSLRVSDEAKEAILGGNIQEILDRVRV